MRLMKAIILNSGMGSRLGDLTKNNPKSMVHLNEKETIFSRAIKILSKFKIDEYIITTGYLDDVLREYAENNFDLNFTFVHNPFYETTNYIKSMDLIGDLNDDIILLHGDLIFTQNVADRVINSKNTSVVIDSTISLPPKDFKAKVCDNQVKYIGVDYFGDDAVACQPFYKFICEDWIFWKNKISEFCLKNQTDVYAENALNTLTDEILINAIDLKGELCMEVDTVEDLNKAKEILK